MTTNDHVTSDSVTASAPSDGPDPANKKRRGAAIGLAGGLIAGTAAGLVFGVPGLTNAATNSVTSVGSTSALVGQTSDPTTDPTTSVPADTSTDASTDAPGQPGDRLRETLQELVDDGTITAEQADAVVAKLIENAPDRGDLGGRRDHRGPGGGFGRGVGGFGAGVVSEALTDLLGLDAQELRTQLRDGLTLAEIASAQGVEPQAVVDELVGELQDRLDRAVTNGRIDQAEADQKLADATDRITDLVDNGRPERADAAPNDEATTAPPTTGD